MASISTAPLLGTSLVFRRLLQNIGRVARTGSSVLLCGESGTGKELVAQTIHRHSPRAGGPFVTVDCGAAVEDLFDSELFGFCRGAFTGAESSRTGKLLAAEGGTLFLDRLDDLSLSCQTRLLRALQEKEVLALGETRARPVNFRLVTAVGQDFPVRLREGTFRQDLYYRVNVVKLELPPLRERKEDIPVLVENFLEEISNRFGKRVYRVQTDALKVLKSYNWPGNVRELRNVMECAIASTRGEVLTESDLPVYVRVQSKNSTAGPPALSAAAADGDDRGVKNPIPFQERVEDFQRNLIVETLQRTSWNTRACADELALSRHQLKYLCTKLGIRRSRFDRQLEH